MNNYASTFGLTGTYATGWYMPSLAELCYLYRSKNVLNSVINILGGMQLFSSFYWSSSQSGYYDNTAWNVTFSQGDPDDAWGVNFYDGLVRYYSKKATNKDCDNYVCCVWAFSE